MPPSFAHRHRRHFSPHIIGVDPVSARQQDGLEADACLSLTVALQSRISKTAREWAMRVRAFCTAILAYVVIGHALPAGTRNLPSGTAVQIPVGRFGFGGQIDFLGRHSLWRHSSRYPALRFRSRRRVPLTDELHEGLVWLCTDDSAAT